MQPTTPPSANPFANLTPEQLNQLLQGGVLQDQGSLLDRELEQLLGAPTQHVEHTSPIGAGLGAIAEALDGTANAFHAKALRGERAKNLEAQSKMVGSFGDLLRGPSAPQAGAAASPAAGMSAAPVADLRRYRNAQRPGIVSQDETPLSAFGF